MMKIRQRKMSTKDHQKKKRIVNDGQRKEFWLEWEEETAMRMGRQVWSWAVESLINPMGQEVDETLINAGRNFDFLRTCSDFPTRDCL